MEEAQKKLELITQYFADFNAEQLKQFSALEEVYRDWNSKINVISRKDEDGLYEKHVLHSLAIAAVFQFVPNMRVLDLGTGGGFPGIPLAIFFPEVKFLLADSIGKKIKVVNEVVNAVGIKNVTAQHTRAEEIKTQKFDVVVSRAVAPLGELWNWSKPLLKARPHDTRVSEAEDSLPVPNGLICLKGGDLATEISESGVRPRQMEVFELFQRDYFKEKYILYVPR